MQIETLVSCFLADVLRTFAFLGFTVVPPTLSPVDNPELVLMGMPLD
jgi:hypothetical protein